MAPSTVKSSEAASISSCSPDPTHARIKIRPLGEIYSQKRLLLKYDYISEIYSQDNIEEISINVIIIKTIKCEWVPRTKWISLQENPSALQARLWEIIMGTKGKHSIKIPGKW